MSTEIKDKIRRKCLAAYYKKKPKERRNKMMHTRWMTEVVDGFVECHGEEEAMRRLYYHYKVKA